MIFDFSAAAGCALGAFSLILEKGEFYHERHLTSYETFKGSRQI
jgi:hypothetical protein